MNSWQLVYELAVLGRQLLAQAGCEASEPGEDRLIGLLIARFWIDKEHWIDEFACTWRLAKAPIRDVLSG